MSIALTSVVNGQDITSDKSRSVVVWEKVLISGVEFKFCQYIISDGVTYIRDKPHDAIMRPDSAHDYYPCHSGTVYGLYNKVDHTFTVKTVSAHGDDVKYAISDSDLRYVTASGYTDITFLYCADGGTQPYVDAEHPAHTPYPICDVKFVDGVFQSWTPIWSAFYLAPSFPLPEDKLINGVLHKYMHPVRYNDGNPNPYGLPMWSGPTGLSISYPQYNPNTDYANGDLIVGRKPRWALFADNVNLGRYLANNKKLSVYDMNLSSEQALFCPNIFKWIGANPLKDGVFMPKWDGYCGSKYTDPFLQIGDDNAIKLELHNGKAVVLAGAEYLNPFNPSFSNLHLTDNRAIWKYYKDMTSELYTALGNVPDWNNVTSQIGVLGLQLVLSYLPYMAVNNAASVVCQKTFWANEGNHAETLNSNSSEAVKKLFRNGKNADDSLHHWDIGIDAAALLLRQADYDANSGYGFPAPFYISMMPLCLGKAETKLAPTWNLPVTLDLSKEDNTEILNYSNDVTRGIEKFRFILKTPTVTVSGQTYEIIPAQKFEGPYSDYIYNHSDRFDEIGGILFIRNFGDPNGISAGGSYGGGIGWRFACRQVNGEITTYLPNRSQSAGTWSKVNRLQCTVDIYTKTASGVIHTQLIKEATVTDYANPSGPTGLPDEYANTRFQTLYSESGFDADLRDSVTDYSGGNYVPTIPYESAYRIAFFNHINQDALTIPVEHLVEVNEAMDGSSTKSVYVLNPNSTVIMSIEPVL